MLLRLVLFLPPLLIGALALPLLSKGIAPNIFMGVRTRATLSDPALWYQANVFFGRWLLVASGTDLFLAEAAQHWLSTLVRAVVANTLFFSFVVILVSISAGLYSRRPNPVPPDQTSAPLRLPRDPALVKRE